MTTLRDMINDFGQECIELKSTVELHQREVLDDDLQPDEEVLEEIYQDRLETLMTRIKERIVG